MTPVWCCTATLKPELRAKPRHPSLRQSLGSSKNSLATSPWEGIPVPPTPKFGVLLEYLDVKGWSRSGKMWPHFPTAGISGWRLPTWALVPWLGARRLRRATQGCHTCTCDPVHAPVWLPPGWRVADRALRQPLSRRLKGFAFKEPYCALPDIISIRDSSVLGTRGNRR